MANIFSNSGNDNQHLRIPNPAKYLAQPASSGSFP
jgi:hypothetical protein